MNSTTPVVIAWLLPIKNGMPYLRETLASIEGQTYKRCRLIAWDNGSTDGSVEEVRRWIPARISGRLITDRPLGLGASLAEMVKLADTEFCARIDADDVNVPTRLERQVAFMERCPEVAVVGSQVIKLDDGGHELGQHDRLPLSHCDIVHRMLHAWVMYHPTVLFRRDVVVNEGNYRDIQPVEDYDLWMRLAVKWKLANLDSCLVKYRVHDGGVTAISRKQGLLDEVTRNCFTRNAPALFGCSEREAVGLRSGRSFLMLPLLLRIVHHLCRTQGGTVMQRARTESFQEAVNALASHKDVVTRLSMACCKPTVKGKLSSAQRALREALTYFSAAVRRRTSRIWNGGSTTIPSNS